MKIAGREIDNYAKPYVVAEVSCNHMGSLNLALELIDAAQWARADAVKFQAYTPDTITLDCNKPDFIVQDGLWKGKTLYELYKGAYTPWEWFPELFKHAQRKGIVCFASVFDPSSVDMLERLGCPAYKIASMEIIDTPLIRYAAKTGKPLIISTGMASDDEILSARAVSKDVAFLHCTSEYPQTVEHSYLNRISEMRSWFGPAIPIGVSDHSKGHEIPIATTAMGTAIIEKHIKLEGKDGEDAEFSLTPEEFRIMVGTVNITYEALQERTLNNNPSRQLRRSLYAVEDILEGEPFTEHNLRSIRPGFGIAPKHLPKLLGKKADKRYRKGDRIT